MNMEQGLKDLLGEADTAGVMKSVTRLSPVGSGAVAELLVTDLDTGAVTAELQRIDDRGRCAMAASLHGAPSDAERRTIEELVRDSGIDVVMGPGFGLATRPEAEPAAAAITALAPDPAARLQRCGDWYVIHAPYAAHLHVVARGQAAPRALDTAPMSLGGRRQITDVGIVSSVLHVAVSDPVAGFDLFRCDLAGGEAAFTPALTRGAYRFALNGAVAAMNAGAHGLLIGTAALAGMAMPVGDWGPELLLVTAQGRWDLLAGQPRFTPDGMMLPASGMMPGLGDTRHAAIKAIAHAEGQTVIAIQGFEGQSQEDRRESRPDFFDYRGPVRLYRSPDLVEWQAVSHALPRDADPVTAMALRGGHLYVGFENLSLGGVPVQVVPL